MGNHAAIVVGTNFGSRVHTPALKVAGISVHALVGRDRERTERAAANVGVPHAYTSLSEALADQEADVVVVATPPATHAAVATAALEAGRHVLCEKPFALSLDEAVAVEELARKRGVVTRVGTEFRFSECVALVERLLKEGAIGEPRFATIVSHGSIVEDTTRPMPDWWFDPTRGGGWLAASGSHVIDRLLQWFGNLASASARLVITSDRDRDLADDSYTIRFTTVGGLEGSVSTSAAAWGGPVSFCRILGSKGTLWIKDLIPRGAVETTSGPVILADAAGVREVVVPEDLRLPLTPAEVDQRVHPAVRPYSRLYREMVDDIEGRRVASSDGSSTLPATFADGVHVMEILDALRVSSKHGGENVAFNIAENS